ncbi:MAG: transporter ATP-binding protein [Acidimicrobiales bacterium]|nr:transporter ATP-binding protein [Acidimicrobiales bacterium]
MAVATAVPGPSVEPETVAREVPVLALKGITKRFPGVTANQDVSLTVGAGEIVGLLGENGAGKTTLMNMVFGLLQPDEGTIEVDGRPLAGAGPREALARGVGMVHQHFKLVPRMTVAENLALGRGSLTPLRLSSIVERIGELSNRFGLGIEAGQVVADLSVGQQQRVEILKLLLRDVRVLILDEPTAVLTPQEWDQLEVILRDLAAAGRSVVFISHKLDELLSVTDRVVVLRDGRVVGEVCTADADKAGLARLMVGRDVVLRTARARTQPGAPVLTLRGVTVREGRTRRPQLDGIDLVVHECEVLGIAGVDGNGQRELIELFCGLRSLDDGEMEVDGVALTPAALHAGTVSVVPDDRHRTACALDLPIAENLLMRDLGRRPLFRRGLVDRRASNAHCDRLLLDYDVRGSGPSARMRELSGGNQQKVVLARELHRSPRLIVASQPTRGLDVGAMEFVYRCLQDRKREGAAILLVSTELNEVLSLSDRVAVMSGGRLSEPVRSDDVDPRELGLLMAAS